MQASPRYRYCFTYFPNEDEDINEVGIEWFAANIPRTLKPAIKYLIMGEEFAPSTGKRHFQGYLELMDKMRINQIKNLLNTNEIHLEDAKGNREQNIKYCSKPNKEGEKEKQIFMNERFSEQKILNQREQQNFNEYIKTHSLIDIEKKYPGRVFNQLGKIINYKHLHDQKAHTWNGELKYKNYWIYGKQGTGKTSWVYRQAQRLGSLYRKNQNKWWDGYESQKIVLIDDWENGDKSDMFIQFIKQWGDRFSFSGEAKGAHQMIHPGRFFLIITSNHSIEESFTKASGVDLEAIKRRFSEIEIFEKEDIWLNNDLDETILEKNPFENSEE